MTTTASSRRSARPAASVTVLGLGAMGKALAGAFRTAGHRTTVWNRTPGRADDLAAEGARVAASAAEGRGGFVTDCRVCARPRRCGCGLRRCR